MSTQRLTLAASVALGIAIALPTIARSEPVPDAPRPAPLKNAAPARVTPAIDTSLDAQFQLAATAGKYLGTENCERCHTAPRPGDPAVPNHVLLNEAAIWKKDDKHYLAYDHLRTGLGQQIGQRLHANVLDPATGCIQCHMTSPTAARAAGDLSKSHVEGVGCEACHGPAEHWIGEHNIHDKWQAKSSKDKIADGFIDIRSSDSRAELCLSCHSGRPTDGRVITHAMYAAGHPPLTGFEIETFADIMPRHWRYPYQKPGAKAASFERTQNMMTASVVGLRMALELAVADATAPNGSDRWPEFARLDCFACHHDIDPTDWRRHENGTAALGHPRLIAGCLPLVAVAARAVQGPGAEAKIDALSHKLQAPFAATAFGDPAEIARLATSIIASCRNLEPSLDSLQLLPDSTREILRSIAAQASAQDCDFDTARQLFGAWCIVWQELVENHVLPKSRAVERGIASGKSFFSLNGAKLTGAANLPDDRSVTDEVSELFGNRSKFEPKKFAAGMAKLDKLATE